MPSPHGVEAAIVTWRILRGGQSRTKRGDLFFSRTPSPHSNSSLVTNNSTIVTASAHGRGDTGALFFSASSSTNMVLLFFLQPGGTEKTAVALVTPSGFLHTLSRRCYFCCWGCCCACTMVDRNHLLHTPIRPHLMSSGSTTSVAECQTPSPPSPLPILPF